MYSSKASDCIGQLRLRVKWYLSPIRLQRRYCSRLNAWVIFQFVIMLVLLSYIIRGLTYRWGGEVSPIPNVVHYTWFAKKPTKLIFPYFLSILSAHKFLQPEAIYFHTNCTPTGEYWQRALAEIEELTVVKGEPPTEISGQPVKSQVGNGSPKSYPAAAADVTRCSVLNEYGGIYLDLDVLVLRSFDELRKHAFVMGAEDKEGTLCGSIVLASSESRFLKLWTEFYHTDYRSDKWAYNSAEIPTMLAKRHPSLIHIEPERLNFPNYKDMRAILGNEIYKWQEKQNYAIHTWHPMWTRHINRLSVEEEMDEQSILSMATTFGQVARYIYYGIDPQNKTSSDQINRLLAQF